MTEFYGKIKSIMDDRLHKDSDCPIYSVKPLLPDLPAIRMESAEEFLRLAKNKKCDVFYCMKSADRESVQRELDLWDSGDIADLSEIDFAVPYEERIFSIVDGMLYVYTNISNPRLAVIMDVINK